MVDIEVFAQSQTTRLGAFLTDGRYSIPDLQRPYSWTKEEAGQLWTDLVEHVESGSTFYFLGNVVFYPEGDVRYVVDGQQRLTTATILLCAARDAISEAVRAGTLRPDQVVGGGDELQLQDHLQAIESNIKKPGTRDKFFLTLKGRDSSRLAWIQARDDQRTKQPDARGKPRIYRVYDLYRASSANLIRAGRIDRLCAITTALADQVVITRTRVKDLPVAYTIFSTVNTRGLDLTLADIVRAEVLASWQKIGREEAPHKIVTLLNEFRSIDYGELPQFVRRFWIARTGRKHSPAETSEKVVGFIRNEAKTKAELTRFVQDAADFVGAYAAYLDIAKGKVETDAEQRVAVFAQTRFQQHIPLVVSAILSREINKPVMNELMATVESIYIHHNLLLESSPSEIEEMFAVAAHAAHSDGVVEATRVLREAFSTFLDQEQRTPRWFLETLSKADLSDGGAHFILRTLERLTGPRESKLNLGRPKEVHLEHILPQDPDITGWGKKWLDADKRDQYLSVIGNLTLLLDKLNQGASNSSFDTKKNEYYQRSEVRLTKDLLQVKEWNEEAIEKRSMELASRASQIWSWNIVAPPQQTTLRQST